jgi:hypothetical protein
MGDPFFSADDLIISLGWANSALGEDIGSAGAIWGLGQLPMGLLECIYRLGDSLMATDGLRKPA